MPNLRLYQYTAILIWFSGLVFLAEHAFSAQNIVRFDIYLGGTILSLSRLFVTNFLVPYYLFKRQVWAYGAALIWSFANLSLLWSILFEPVPEVSWMVALAYCAQLVVFLLLLIDRRNFIST